MKFEVGDKVKINKVMIPVDTVCESIDFLGQVGYITEVFSGFCQRGTEGSYYDSFVTGYRLNIGKWNWIWTEEELVLIDSYNKDKIQCEIIQVQNRLVELTN